jgi:hypothetical protein
MSSRRKTPTPVAVLGATGTVGQRFIQLLEGHPWFYVAEVMASDQSAGKPYLDALGGRWKLTTPVPGNVTKLRVKGSGDALKSPVLFSSMDASVAGELETQYARAGHLAEGTEARQLRQLAAGHREVAGGRRQDSDPQLGGAANADRPPGRILADPGHVPHLIARPLARAEHDDQPVKAGMPARPHAHHR